MVGHNTHCHSIVPPIFTRLCCAVVSFAAFLCNKLYQRLKNIRIVVRCFILQHTLTKRSKPIPVSTCLAGSGCKLLSFKRLNCMKTLFQISITWSWSSALTRVAPLYCFSLSRIRAVIVVNFRTRAAGAGFAHFPKVVFFITRKICVLSSTYCFHKS